MSWKELDQPQWVPYLDLSGGLNTRKDPHALDRNQLAVSVNTWLGTGNAISKRPGNIPYPQVGGTNPNFLGMARCFYSQQTVVIGYTTGGVLYYARPTDSQFTSIGAATSGGTSLNAAQMYDPTTGLNQTFLVDGVETPRTWQGPGTSLGTVVTTGTNCPYNHSNAAPITPKFVTTAGFYLVYAGEPTEPTAVYISNPYYPQVFNNSATTTSGILPNPYIPYLVGFNDGVNGGDITGILVLANGTATGAIMVYKQAAVYQMNQVGFFGEMYWGATLVSASTGCLSPQSIVGFDTFHCFLGVDGVYQTDGLSVRRISDNVPTLFDSTLVGTSAAILNRTSAVAVRHGQRYIIFFDDGNGTTSPAGHPTLGAVFDFSRPDADGYPGVTLIRGMSPTCIVPMRGPADDGNFVWCNYTGGNNIFRFGVGSSDNGADISVSFFGKADFMVDPFGPDAPVCNKAVTAAYLLVSTPSTGGNETLTFTAYATMDFGFSSETTGAAISIMGGAIYGTSAGAAIYGQSVYTSGSNPNFALLKFQNQVASQGHVCQFGFSESSSYAWTILGYDLYVAKHKASR
jgi:hypothetical protein